MAKQSSLVIIPNTEIRTLTSSIVDQDFLVYVSLPRKYDGSSKTYPVVYVLDANSVFGIFTETTRLLLPQGELPEMIIVGIGYPAENYEELSLRMRDYTPSKDDSFARKWIEDRSDALGVSLEFHGTGGAGKFLDFIRVELMPFISSNYPVDDGARCLAGKSLGGLFALYTLFQRPSIFDRYIIGSPSIWWDDRIVLAYEEQYAEACPDLQASIFMSVGSLEDDIPEFNMIGNMQRLTKSMDGRGYDGFELKTFVFEDETHFSVIPATISKGLRAVFGRDRS